MNKTRKVLLTLLALALLKTPLDMLLAAMLPDAAVNPLANAVAGAAVSIVLLGLSAWRLWPWSSLRLPQKRTVWPGALLGVAMALLTRSAVAPAEAAWQGMMGLAPDALPVPEAIPTAVVYILCLAVIPAVTEEVFFRGALLTGLLDGSRRVTALLLTAAAFALMHGSLASLPGLLVISLVLTLVMLHTGRIMAAVATHFFYNISALAWTGIPGWGSGLCCVALIGLMAYIILCQPRLAHLPMKKADGLIAAATLIVLAALYFI